MPRKLACDFPLPDGSACEGCDRCARRAYARERYRWPGRADAQREAVTAHQEANREQMRARRRENPWKEPDSQKEIARRIARQIPHQPCEWVNEDGTVCGEQKTQRHHPDYSKPLEVVHLCKTHHGLTHRIV